MVEGRVRGQEREQVDEPRHGPVRRLERAQGAHVAPVAVDDAILNAKTAPQVWVVREHGNAVTCQVDVGLESVGSGRDRRSEGVERVLGALGAVAPVRDDLREGAAIVALACADPGSCMPTMVSSVYGLAYKATVKMALTG